jgi:thimet oligopeptidase
MGFELAKEERTKLQDNLKKLSELSNLYAKNINEYQDFILVTEEELEGLPEHFASTLEKEGERYKVNLDYPQYFPFMENAVLSQKRKELMDKYLFRICVKNLVEQSKKKWKI